MCCCVYKVGGTLINRFLTLRYERGTLEAQQQELLGYPASTTGLYASASEISPADFQLSMLLRSRLLAELADSQLNR